MRFLSSNDNLDAVIAGSYNVLMVSVSVFIACAGAYAAFAFAERLRASHSRLAKWSWLICGALTLGSGIWAMHFVGMLAYRLPFEVTYDAFITSLSVTPAVLAGGVALYLTSLARIDYRHILFGGICMGLGIGAMHYTGMAAMRMEAVMGYDPLLFTLSILVAAALAIIALYLEVRIVDKGLTTASEIRKVLTALVMGAAVSGMHYTAMTATYIFPGDNPGDNIVTPGLSLDSTMLATLVILFTVTLITLLYAATAIGRRIEATALLSKAKDDLVNAIEAISDGFVIFDEQGRLVMTNSIFRTLHPQISSALKPGTSYEDFLRAWVSQSWTAQSREAPHDEIPAGMAIDDYVRQQCQTLFSEGSSDQERYIGNRWLHVKERKTGGRGLVGIWSDITQFKEMQELLEQMAHYDNLTGLANRHLFNIQLQQAIARVKRNQQQIALLYIDLDGFKAINDSLGHDAGDDTLREVSRRLKTCVRANDTIARLGGDEFAVIIDGPSIGEISAEVARRILTRLSEPVEIAGTQKTIGASIGISIYPIDADSVDDLINKADAAMYEVKNTGRNNIRFAAQNN